MKNKQRTSIMLRLFLALSFLVFSSLTPFAHIHDSSHRDIEHAEFHLHITYDDDRDCSSADEEQPADDHHWFGLSCEAYTYTSVPLLHQGFSPDNQVKSVSHQSPICSPWNCFIAIPTYIFNFDRGSPPEINYSQIIPHFFTDLSPPLG